ncbi:MAG: hypothetical protein NZ699_09345 [Roseiflexus sp.]|nr:hypothetical protein [Roseiflexus sp.]MDW8145048.1 hypothetical protein [Roseiflexaceae bacterium]
MNFVRHRAFLSVLERRPARGSALEGLYVLSEGYEHLQNNPVFALRLTVDGF